MAILVPAAGASRRMRGRDKLLEYVRGRALLADRVAVALGTGLDVLVTVPPGPPGGGARAAALEPLAGPRLWVEEVADAGEGMAASLRRGADWARMRALMVLLPDLPDLTQDDVQTVLDAFDGRAIVQATAEDGRAGHPVVFPARYLPELAALKGDEGARAVLAAHEVVHVALTGSRAVTDLDTPEDWAVWRARDARKP